MHSFENLMKFTHPVSLKMHMNTEILNLRDGCQPTMYGEVLEVSIFLLNFYANICVYIHGEQLFYLSSKIYFLHTCFLVILKISEQGNDTHIKLTLLTCKVI